MEMMYQSEKMRKARKSGFIQDGYTLSPKFRGQQMINILNRHHYHIRIFNPTFRNKYASTVWHNTGNTGAGCRTCKIRFQY